MKVLIYKKKIKSVIIKVMDAETVLVSVPFDMSDEVANEFIRLKSSWIKRKQEEKKKNKIKNEEIYSYKKILIQGKEYVIAYSDVPNVCCVEDYLILPQSKAESVELIKKTINNYLLNLAKNLLPKYLAFWGEKLSLCPTAIKIKSLKSKWGSCNGNGEIVLNVKLIQLPVKLIEYVIVHELCHLKNLNHSKDFWESIEDVFADFDILRKELRQYEYLIEL